MRCEAADRIEALSRVAERLKAENAGLKKKLEEAKDKASDFEVLEGALRAVEEDRQEVWDKYEDLLEVLESSCVCEVVRKLVHDIQLRSRSLYVGEVVWRKQKVELERISGPAESDI